jgi:MtN3 and saliva related transmembrane protein
MPDVTTLLGMAAAGLTSLSYVPQVRKALPRGATEDLSLRMLLALVCGLLLWCIYGIVKNDVVIILANVVGAALVGIVLMCKLRDMRSRLGHQPDRMRRDGAGAQRRSEG